MGDRVVKTPARLKSIVQIDHRKRCTDTGGWIKISNASSARTKVSPSTSLQCGPQNVCTQQPSGRCVSKLWMFVGSSSMTTKDVTVGAPRKNIAISSPRVCSCNTGVSPMTGTPTSDRARNKKSRQAGMVRHQLLTTTSARVICARACSAPRQRRSSGRATQLGGCTRLRSCGSHTGPSYHRCDRELHSTPSTSRKIKARRLSVPGPGTGSKATRDDVDDAVGSDGALASC